MTRSLFRNPSAVIPIAMSAGALAALLIHVMTTGDASATGEGTAAQVFQLMFAGQAPFVAYFALKWLPRMPSEAMYVIATQAAAALVALAPVVLFDL